MNVFSFWLKPETVGDIFKLNISNEIFNVPFQQFFCVFWFIDALNINCEP